MVSSTATAPPAEESPPHASEGGGAETRAGIRALLLRVHFYAGVLIAPFLLVAAVTGLCYTAMPQVERTLYAHELEVTPRGAPDPLAEQVAAAEKAVPDGTLVSVTTGPGPRDSTRVVFEEPGLKEGYTRTAFVDPYGHSVLGTLETFGQWLPVRAWFDDLHRNLHLGEFGRNYSEIAASWLWVEVAGGLVLWTGLRRSRRRLRRTLLPERSAPAGRRRVRSWHGAVGLWAAAGLLGLSATGLTWSAYAGANITQLREQLHSPTPEVAATLPHTHVREETDGRETADGGKGRKDIGFDGAVRSAREAGLGGVLDVTPPADGDSAYVVKENTRSWPERQDSVAVEPHTGKVTATLRFDDYPLLAKLSRWGVDAHMGLLFGLVNQIVLALLALALIAMTVWGYRMWWLRRPTRNSASAGRLRRPGRAPARGTWRRVPGRVLAPAAVVTALVAYWLPWFGVPLLLFLAVDLLAGRIRHGRATKEAGL
ncbi:putative iron-regulated membrane protein [Streptomyces sp. Amel2xB2]|uniref:PepSY-associated TM helix domain-containing protein n=1 Tax=Streptomyces sp. Amel2xB2 TaxID=1305829 RepID=UPI000DBA15DD|nr:PepSY domain-containing protein [Streptomyces sp. Amel2xB2]RAJ60500.1 putative iron-regulated membrane protein [Streptomyces sp. Amel2xB2]